MTAEPEAAAQPDSGGRPDRGERARTVAARCFRAARAWLRGPAALDATLALLLFAGYLAWLLGTTHDLGYARDEGFYFSAADSYRKWFELLLADPRRAVEPSLVDRYWSANHEHPALMKSLFGISKKWLTGVVPVDGGTLYRLPAMVISAGAVAVCFAWGRAVLGRAGGLVAALSLALMPRVFYHSHLACFDMPIAAMWLMVLAAYFRSLRTGKWRWVAITALLFGLALDTKHNAWMLPGAVGLHWLLRRWLAGELLRLRTLLPPPAALASAIAGPLVMYALWPWIWRDTWARLAWYVKFHTQHVYYNMEFLGRTYFEPPMPLGYAWGMTLATVPAVTLALCGIGSAVSVARAVAQRRAPRASSLPPALDACLLWGCGVLVCYAPWLLSRTPIFGGTKHWITAYPLMALLAGRGFVWVVTTLQELLSELTWRRTSEPVHSTTRSTRAGRERFVQRLSQALPVLVGLCVSIGPLAMTRHSHPWGLSAYTPLVGGAAGAASLGLNRTFWGYTTGAITAQLDALAASRPRSERRVFPHDTAYQSFRRLQYDGKLDRSLKIWPTVSGSNFALYHHEQHMSRVEHMIWVDYGTVRPIVVGAFDGVPVVLLYER